MISKSQPYVLLLVLCLCTTVGCVRRRVTLRTNVPGARAYVDKVEVGETPVAFPMTYYGTREIRLERDGYETVKQYHKFNPPWYQIPVVDFFAENLWPFEIRDERELHFALEPQKIVPQGQLLERANNLRTTTSQGHTIPLAP